MKHFLLASLFGVLLPCVMAAEPGRPRPAADPLGQPPPLPSLIEFAEAHRIPIRGFEFAGDRAMSLPGDRVTLLVVLQRGGAEEQWLVCLTAAELTAAEQRMKPPGDAVMFTSTGHELRFANSRAALDAYLVGPFTANAAGARPVPAETHARALVSAEHLTHGLERFARSALDVGRRMREAGLTRVAYGTQGRPFPEEILKIGRAWAAKASLTVDEERWENEAYFAMVAFFETARRIPAFRALAEPILAWPSLWSMGTHLGVSTRLVFAWSEVEAVESTRAPVAAASYRFPLNVWFNDTLGTRATLVVTAPRPPLQVGAGIVALCAEHPDAPDRRLFIRVLAARPATERLQTKFENAP